MIYLDNAATTQLNSEVKTDIIQALTWFGNPSSPYQLGHVSRSVIEEARKNVAEAINAEPEEIIFTSGGSEGNNMALKGIANAYGIDTFITTAIEHPSISKVGDHLTSRYFNIIDYLEYMPIDNTGTTDLKKFKELLKESDESNCKTSLVAIGMVNNEIGTIQPIKEIVKILREHCGFIHVDAVQAFPHMKIDVKDLDVDTMAVSGHKFGCPKGIGFLYVRKDLELEPLIHGGSQEFGLRAGTENTPYIYAIGNQVKRLQHDLQYDSQVLAIDLWESIKTACDNICKTHLNGAQDFSKRIDGLLNICFEGYDADTLITLLSDRGVYVAAGAACCSGERTPSKVLKAIGLSDFNAYGSLRISWDKNTTWAEMSKFIQTLKECLEFLK